MWKERTSVDFDNLDIQQMSTTINILRFTGTNTGQRSTAQHSAAQHSTAQQLSYSKKQNKKPNRFIQPGIR